MLPLLQDAQLKVCIKLACLHILVQSVLEWSQSGLRMSRNKLHNGRCTLYGVHVLPVSALELCQPILWLTLIYTTCADLGDATL